MLIRCAGKELTILEVVQRLVPDIFPTPIPVDLSETSAITAPAPSHAVAILHGIPLPMAAPILWLSRHLSYPDNFLHLAVTTAPSGT